MLLDVVTGAVGGDAIFGLAAEEFVDRGVEGFADDVPEGDVDAADSVHGDAHAAVAHGGAPHHVPEFFDVEGVFAEEELYEVLFDDVIAGAPAVAVALDAFVGGDLDGEVFELAGIRIEEGAGGFVLGVDGHRVGDLYLLRAPGAGQGLEWGDRDSRTGLHDLDAGDLHLAGAEIGDCLWGGYSGEGGCCGGSV